jgi:hypothetical protein
MSEISIYFTTLTIIMEQKIQQTKNLGDFLVMLVQNGLIDQYWKGNYNPSKPEAIIYPIHKLKGGIER